MTTPAQAIATVDSRPYFERVLRHPVVHDRLLAELLLDPEQPVILGDPVGPRRGSGLDLPAAARDREVRDGYILGFPRPV